MSAAEKRRDGEKDRKERENRTFEKMRQRERINGEQRGEKGLRKKVTMVLLYEGHFEGSSGVQYSAAFQ